MPATLNASGGGSPSNNVVNNSGKAYDRDMQSEFALRQFEEMERLLNYYFDASLATYVFVTSQSEV